jgi:hypothetical protein
MRSALRCLSIALCITHAQAFIGSSGLQNTCVARARSRCAATVLAAKTKQKQPVLPPEPEFSRSFKLSELARRPKGMAIEAKEEEMAALAERFGVSTQLHGASCLPSCMLLPVCSYKLSLNASIPRVGL